jgi:sugar phosphate permease
VVDVYLPVRIAQVAADPAPAIGLILGIAGLVTALSTWVASRLVDDEGGIRWLYPGMIVATLSTIGMAFAPDLWLIAALTWSHALPFALANTLLYAHLARVLSSSDRTAILSLTPMPRNLASFVMPLIAAAVAPVGVGVALTVGAACYLASALTGWLAHRATPAALQVIAEERSVAVSDA